MTLFDRLGYSVLSVQAGVYHLRRNVDGNAEAVGLLLSPDTPLTADTRSVKLFLEEVKDVPAARIVYHWQSLDARRFEESGMHALALDLEAGQIPAQIVEKGFTRPDGARVRHATTLVTGEVVCYN